MPEKKVKILLDLPVEDGVLGFDNYRDALVNIIKGSEPRFTIGIFGSWGTGKTTLMRMMKKKLDDDGEITVWFNPWQYEKEEHLIIPLLQTINLELKTRNLLKSQTLEKFGKVILALMSGISAKIPVGVEISSKDAIETYQKLFESKNSSSLYFELRQQLSEIVKELNTKGKSRIIIFIDDLDRCLPEEALQVLESIKVTLDMDGYVFAIGLSRDIIEKCVDKKYGRESGISGSDYIKKIIQAPFNLPGLREQEVKTYVQWLRDQLKETAIEQYVEKYIDIISKGMEANPREIKRFINNFILVNQISAGQTEPDKLLVMLIIYFRWDELYEVIVNYKKDFLEKLKYYMDIKPGVTDEKGIDIIKIHCGIHYDFLTKIEGHPLYPFLNSEQGKRLFEIADLDPYIHFSKAAAIPESDELERKDFIASDDLISLLKNGKIDAFNNLRPRPFLRFVKVQLRGLNLNSVDLSNADLRHANLSGIKKEYEKGPDQFTGLHGVSIQGRQTYLEYADLRSANLSNANLSGVVLTKSDLTGANLYGIIIDNETVFNKTIIQGVKALAPEIKNMLHIEAEDGVKKATNIKLLLEP